jgi:hypothetical protein
VYVRACVYERACFEMRRACPATARRGPTPLLVADGVETDTHRSPCVCCTDLWQPRLPTAGRPYLSRIDGLTSEILKFWLSICLFRSLRSAPFSFARSPVCPSSALSVCRSVGRSVGLNVQHVCIGQMSVYCLRLSVSGVCVSSTPSPPLRLLTGRGPQVTRAAPEHGVAEGFVHERTPLQAPRSPSAPEPRGSRVGRMRTSVERRRQPRSMSAPEPADS